MDWISWYIVLGLTFASQAFECPEGAGCSSCLRHPEGKYDIDCTTSTDGIFKVSIGLNEYVTIGCHQSANWTEFYLGEAHPLPRVHHLLFRSCDLPEGTGLNRIARQLLTDDVEILDFQSYKGLNSTLTKESLRGFEGIKKLTLSNNGFTELPENLLEDLENLTLLNLRENHLQSLPAKFFSVRNLETVELGMNKIESFDPRTFENLQKVSLLNIWSNKLVEILPHTFDNLSSLTTLSMHRNLLTTLPSDIFARLGNLISINLSQNNFSANSLPADLFRHNNNLKYISLFENKQNITTLPSGFFANLPKLESLKLRKSGFLTLSDDLFRGSRNLRNLSLERNYLTTLPSKIFSDNPELYVLNLSFNDISHLPDDVFASLGKLIKLDLSMNHLTTVSDTLFSDLVSLRELNMERNDLVNIHVDAFFSVRKLHIAKFSYNSLTLRTLLGVGPGVYMPVSPFNHCKELEELYLAHNNISDIFEDWQYSLSLRVLNLAHNQLSMLKGPDLNFLSHDISVDLTYNNISLVDLKRVELWAVGRNVARNVIVSIGNNPLRCDCSLYHLLLYLEGLMHPHVQNAFHLNIGQLKCKDPHDFRDIDITKLNSQTLKCNANTVMGLGLEHGQSYNCPEKCNCYVRPADKAVEVNCAHMGLTEAPPRLDCPPEHHIEINLSGNFLTKMPSFDQPGYDNVTIIALDHNRISSLQVDKFPQNLQALQLNDNNLTRMNEDVINLLKNASSLKKLTLQANPWACDCEASDLLNFIQSKSTELPDLLKATCFDDNHPIAQLTPGDICSQEIGWIIGSCLVVAFLGIIIGSLAALYYRYQREVKVWLYARQWCLWLVTEDELDRDKLYDAFISYSHKDEEFVVNDLVPKLEEGPRPFKLCIHIRDWLAGEWIPKQIARSVEESRRTIVVLSPNFLESVWGRMEFRAAHSQALSEGRARVIVILYGDIGPTDDLDPELKAYLSMNTYVKWGDPWFWEKLKYALPHPPDFRRRRNAGRNIFETTQPRIHIDNDKSELINQSGVPPTPPAATTPPADAVKIFIPNGVTHNELDKPLIKDLNVTALPIVITNHDTKQNNVKLNKVQCTTV